MRVVRVVIERGLIPTKEDIEALRHSGDPLVDHDLLENPGRFFAFVDEPLETRELSAERVRSLAGGCARRRQFRSDYRPYLKLADESPEVCGRIGRRDPIRIEHWEHESQPTRGTVIALHGFAMGRPSMGAVALFASQWFERGLDVVLVTLPEHGERAPDSARFSGECFAVPHVARLAEAVRSAIYEVLVVRNWLRSRSSAPVGLLGLSLGGYLTSLAAGLSEDFDFAVPIVAPACMGDLAWRLFRETRHCREGGAASIDEGLMRACFRVHSPLAHPLRVPKERVLIVAGRGDRVVPPQHPTALWEHWGEPPIHWFNGGHITPFGRARVLDAISGHLASLGIL